MKPVPNYIASKARARVEASKAKVNEVIKLTKEGRSLDAEKDNRRKLHRLQRVADVDLDEAVKLASYDDYELSKLTGDKRLGAERIQGKTRDFVGVAFLELARTAASAVCRVVTQDFQAIGTGFMISERLFLTNNHVIPDIDEAQRYLIEFNYEMGINKQPRPISRFVLRPEEFFVTNAEDDLDFTIVAVGEPTDDEGRLSDFGYCPLIGSDDKHVLGEFVNIIQHPEGDYKQVVLRENQLVTRLDKVLHYLADTNPGSSGSPVFNDQWEVIALHHWGGPTELVSPNGEPLSKDVNEGVRISKILSDLKSKSTNIMESQRILINAVLNPQSRQPRKVQDKAARGIPEQKTSSQDRSLDYISQETKADGTVAWKIPLEVSVRLVGLMPPQQSQSSKHIEQVEASKKDSDTTIPTLEEAVHIDPNYSNRSGYDPKFLLGHSIPLPKLNASQKKKAAKLLKVSGSKNPIELKYQHFSIVMNADRRIAFFTAANVDGSKWIDIDRDTGEPKIAEAAEKWFQDPRIDLAAQYDQSLFSHQIPEHVFDRGHLVRRQDPDWGTADIAKRANADTFHFTNCSTQEWSFNQNKKFWQGIENYILDNAKAEHKRVIVFTGPVLAKDDPEYRSIKVPMQFWKILVRVDEGHLLTTALLADQSKRITRLPEGLYAREAFDDMSKIIEYQTSVREIEKLTGLGFGSLRQHDTFQDGPERAIGHKVKLESFDDIKLDDVT